MPFIGQVVDNMVENNSCLKNNFENSEIRDIFVKYIMKETFASENLQFFKS